MQKINSKLLLAYIVLLFFVFSCKRDALLDTTKNSDTTKNDSSAYSLAINKVSGEVQLFKDFHTDPDYVSLGSDMLVHKSQIETIKKYESLQKIDWDDVHKTIENNKNNPFAIRKRQAKNPSYGEPVCIWEGAMTWTCNYVTLQISNKFSDKQTEKIFTAILAWMIASHPNIIWHVSIEGDQPFIDGATRIEPSGTLFKECVSTLGELPANRGIAYISDRCSVADILHNIGHILGFVDEERRPKRDDFVTLKQSALDLVKHKFGNIDFQFIKASLETVRVQSDDFGFDHESIMINSSFSTNPVIEEALRKAKQPLYTDKSNNVIEQPKFLSFSDAIKVRRVYPVLYDDKTRNDFCKCKF